MAWRLTAYQSFVSNSTVITAAYENAIQTAITDLFNGNYTVKRLHADGTGDAATGAVAGEVRGNLVRATGASGIIADAGPITATSGTVSATGTIAGKSGPGLGIFKRLYLSGGTAAASAGAALSAGWGNTAAMSGFNGTDACGQVGITCNGTGIAASPTFSYTFRDGTFTSTPIVLCWMINVAGGGTFTPMLTNSISASGFQATFNGTPSAGGQYTIIWIAIGT
jgi:hypothetical protein